MPVFLTPVDYDKDFSELDPSKVIIINDLPNRTEEDRLRFESLIKEVYTDDMISMLPTCQCKTLRGEHLVGEICDNCQTPVKPSIDEDIKSILWFRAPEGVDRLINPWFYCILQARFSKRSCNVLEWLLDRNYVLPPNYPEIIDKMILDNIPRGLNNFYRHFDDIFEYLMSSGAFNDSKMVHKMVKGMVGIDDKEDVLRRVVRDFRHLIFCRYIPMLNKTLLVVEKNDLSNYVESHVIDIHNTLNTMLSIDRDHYDRKPTTVENRTARILKMLAAYYRRYISTNIKPKPGLMRKHIYGTRGNTSFRCVITSHDSLHKHNEIYVPWGIGVTTFWLHHMAILTRRGHPLGGLTYSEATDLLMRHVGKYHPLIDTLLKKLISDAQASGRPGIACITQRN